LVKTLKLDFLLALLGTNDLPVAVKVPEFRTRLHSYFHALVGLGVRTLQYDASQLAHIVCFYLLDECGPAVKAILRKDVFPCGVLVPQNLDAEGR